MRSRRLLVITAVVAALGAAVWFVAGGGGHDASGGEARRGTTRAPEASAPVEDASGAQHAAAPASDAAPQRAVEPAANARRIFGRVVDARRFGVAGARVRFASDGRTPLEVTSREGGAFEFALASVGSRYLWGALLAVGPDGAIGDGRAVLGPDREDGAYDDEHPRDFDVGALAILPPARLVVHVRDEHGPVAGAEVTADVSSQAWVPITACLPAVTTAADGVAVLAAPRCDATVIASVPGRASARTWTTCESGVEQTIELLLHPSCSVTIRVRDAQAHAAVANAHVVVDERTVMRQAREFSYIGPELAGGSSDLPDLVCDADGVTHLDDFDPERHLSLKAQAPGYGATQQSRALLDASSRDVELLLVPRGTNEIRLPIVADEAPVPTDGSVVVLRANARSADARLPSTATVERGELVIVGAPEGWHPVIATAPDGSLADFEFGSELNGPATLRFKRPRTLDLDLRFADGRIAAGARVQLDGQKTLPPSLQADDQGRIVQRGLLARRVDVGAEGTFTVAQPLATVDLRAGDARIDVVVPERFEAVLEVTLDGRPGLPPTYRVSSRDFFWKVEAEDPERGEVRVSALAGAQEKQVEAGFVAVPFLPAKLDVPVVRGAAPPVVPVALVRGARLRLDVKRAANQKFGLRIQRQGDDGKFANLDAQFRAIDRLNGPNGLFDFSPLQAGTWRVQDEVTQITSEPIALALGEDRTELLDLSSAIVIRGRVTAPEGTDFRSVRVVARGEPEVVGTDRFSRPVYPGTFVLPDGTFERTIDGARPFVRAWHPSLAPPVGDAYVEVRDPTRPVLLPLVDRPSLVFTLVREGGPIHVDEKLLNASVAITLDREDGDHAHVTRSVSTTGAASEVVHLVEIPTGRWTLFLDPGGEAAPLLHTGVEIPEGGADLGTLTLGPGSVLRLQIADERANKSGALHLHARHVGAPDYSRFWSRNVGPELLLPGLGAGRFDVTIGDSTGKQLWTGTAECDGAHETALAVDLR
jgi:hypothetical protein